MSVRLAAWQRCPIPWKSTTSGRPPPLIYRKELTFRWGLTRGPARLVQWGCGQLVPETRYGRYLAAAAVPGFFLCSYGDAMTKAKASVTRDKSDKSQERKPDRTKRLSDGSQVNIYFKGKKVRRGKAQQARKGNARATTGKGRGTGRTSGRS